jgi:Ca2+-binding RTX toxin-like protein
MAAGTGNSLANIMTGSEGNDTLDGGVEGVAANDTLIGGKGDDTYILQNSGDKITENAGEGTDTAIVEFTGYTLAANVEILQVKDTAGAVNETASSAGSKLIANGSGNTLNGGTGADVLVGGAGDDKLAGGNGNDTLSGGGGTDILTGGQGADTYLVAHGDGTSKIDNSSTDAALDTLTFGSGIDDDQLWFTRNGNDLAISVIGASDQAVITNWYSAAADKLDKVQISNGEYLNTSDVESLVSAMAGFAPPSGSATAIDPSVASALAPTLAASWHHA